MNTNPNDFDASDGKGFTQCLARYYRIADDLGSYLCCRYRAGHAGRHNACYDNDASKAEDWFELRESKKAVCDSSYFTPSQSILPRELSDKDGWVYDPDAKLAEMRSGPVSVAIPVDAQEVLADPKATKEQIDAAYKKEIVKPCQHSQPQDAREALETLNRLKVLAESLPHEQSEDPEQGMVPNESCAHCWIILSVIPQLSAALKGAPPTQEEK